MANKEVAAAGAINPAPAPKLNETAPTSVADIVKGFGVDPEFKISGERAGEMVDALTGNLEMQNAQGWTNLGIGIANAATGIIMGCWGMYEGFKLENRKIDFAEEQLRVMSNLELNLGEIKAGIMEGNFRLQRDLAEIAANVEKCRIKESGKTSRANTETRARHEYFMGKPQMSLA